MKVKKRKKSTRYRGSRLNRRGYKNRTKGSGNRGGYGMAGTGKRGDQKKTLVLNLYGNKYFKKDRSVTRKWKVPSMSIRTIEERLGNFVKSGKAKQTSGGYEIDLSKYKIVGDTKTDIKMVIKALGASANARKAIESAGGSIL
ncbi:MAG: uL15m family ribosomal protein [Nanoarchaeota archaeon]